MKKLPIVVIFSGLLLFFLISFLYLRKSRNITSNPSPDTSVSRVSDNPFGVMSDENITVDTLKSLGVTFFRPQAIFVERPNLDNGNIDRIRDSGIKIILDIRNSKGSSVPPVDLESYKTTVRKILERYRPAVLTVENEMNNRVFFSGSADQYLNELKAACQVSHSLNISCSDGALDSHATSMVVLKGLLNSGNDFEAVTFANHVHNFFSNFPNDSTADALRSEIANNANANLGKLIASYKDAGSDYVNFHLYISDELVIKDTVGYLRSISGNLPVITNEFGQRDTDPSHTVTLVQTLHDQQVPIAVYFSMNTLLGAKSLINSVGSLNPMGQEFSKLIKSWY